MATDISNEFSQVQTTPSILELGFNATVNPPREPLPIEFSVSDNLWKYVGILIIITGTIGHLLSIVVLLSSRTMRLQSSTVYMVAMSLAGLTSLYTGLLRNTVFIGITSWNLDMRNSSEFACRFHSMLTYLSLQYFAWMQATVASDRLISVLMPHKYKISCKWKVGIITTLTEFILICGLNLIVPFSMARNERKICVAQNREFFLGVWNYIDLSSFSFAPAVVIIVCNSIILILLNRTKLNQSHKKKAKALTTMLMSLNAIFVVTTLPVSCVGLIKWGRYPEKLYAVNELCWTIFSLLQYFGSACTFLIYCITGSKFREEFFALMGSLCGRHSTKIRKGATALTNKLSYSLVATNFQTQEISMNTPSALRENTDLNGNNRNTPKASKPENA